jgi:hypothetical protein
MRIKPFFSFARKKRTKRKRNSFWLHLFPKKVEKVFYSGISSTGQLSPVSRLTEVLYLPMWVDAVW